MDTRTRNLLTSVLALETEKFLKNSSVVVSADELAAQLNVSRSVVSKYLNEMAKNHDALKIITRPVIFLDKKIVEQTTGIRIRQEEFLSVQEFLNMTSQSCGGDGSLDEAVGSRGSLHDIIRELKSCAKYPSKNGRAILLLGEPGTGKKYLTHSYASYLASFGEKGLVTVVQCAKGTRSLKECLFGDADSHGLLASAQGVVYFNDAPSLPREMQEDLALLIENGYVLRKNGKTVRCQARLIFGSDWSERERLSVYLAKVIPVHISLPSLQDRPMKEKELLIQRVLMEEQLRLDCQLQISNAVYNILLRHEFSENIDGLRDVVISLCAKANIDRKGGGLSITARHLPSELFVRIKDTIYDEQRMLTLQELKDVSDKDSVTGSYTVILKRFQELAKNPDSMDRETFFDLVTHEMNQCCDHIVFEKKPDAARMDAIRGVLGNVFAAIQDKVNIYARFRFVEVLAALTYKKLYLDSNIQTWEEENDSELSEMLDFVKAEMGEEYRIAADRIGLLRQILNVGACSMDQLFAAVNLRFLGSNPYRTKTAGLILAHGYATASSIADSVNRMLNTYIFDAIDMPLDVSAAEIAELVTEYIKSHRSSDNLVLLVDMGSLESVTEQVGDGTNLQIGIMNNVSTRCALDVGSRIMSYESLEEILSHACESNENRYRILSCKKRQDAIFVTTEAGDAATERVIRLFEKSLPKKIDVRFVAVDSRQLWAEGAACSALQTYCPLFIVCTMDTGIREIPQLLLEDIIGLEDIGALRKLFGNYFDYGELQQFAENLLKNFTLENVIENITILNPNILLSFIERAIQSLERDCKLRIPAKTKITLYIHTCCMVERIITKTMPEETGDSQDFAAQKKDFVTSFRNCFSEITEHYHISIPVSEIEMAYHYVYCEKRRETNDFDNA